MTMPLVLQAAASGEGFALGWDHVVRGLVDRRMLTARKDWAWRTGNGIYLVWSRGKPLPHHARMVRDWMITVSNYSKGLQDPQDRTPRSATKRRFYAGQDGQKSAIRNSPS